MPSWPCLDAPYDGTPCRIEVNFDFECRPICCDGAELPETLTCDIDLSIGTACESGTSVTLTYNSTTQKWEGTAAFGTCGHNIILKFYCVGPDCDDFRLDVGFDDDCGGDVPPNTQVPASGGSYDCSCDPLDVWFTEARGGIWGHDCSDGTHTASVTRFHVTP